ncbi:hypothetical protein [Tellurirhabdus bombi]|uniref:hypothetical protein n=1 Tax=Tellurirhabdus bombi TaxID=2907205 RepID=UPI001F2EFB0B|nr:hypothetical protein [Tellurirhabdus bombi]
MDKREAYGHDNEALLEQIQSQLDVQTDSLTSGFKKINTAQAVTTHTCHFQFFQPGWFPDHSFRLVFRLPKLLRLSETPYFFFSYFRRIFGHHIAINAP